jgi:hypothetical protein
MTTLETVTRQMDQVLGELREQADSRRYFHATYLRTTRAVTAELNAGGFLDTPWVQRWTAVFAGLYLTALSDARAGRPAPAPWAAAFGADPGLPPVRHVLLGMNAHINYDLPHALLQVISDAEFADPACLDRREADHRHIDQVLSTVVDQRRWAGPVNRLAVKRFLIEARVKVWRNAGVLSSARQRSGKDYQARSAELEQLAAARVTALTRPGPVLQQLAVGGFGVRLRPDGFFSRGGNR